MNFKEFPKGFNEATVRDLKEKCKLLTDVPVASMKLQVSGGKLRNVINALELMMTLT